MKQLILSLDGEIFCLHPVTGATQFLCNHCMADFDSLKEMREHRDSCTRPMRTPWDDVTTEVPAAGGTI